MTTAPRWLREFGKVWLEYVLMGAAGIPAAVVYFALLRSLSPGLAMGIAVVVGVLLGYCLRGAARRAWAGQPITAVQFTASGSLITGDFSPGYATATACLVLTIAAVGAPRRVPIELWGSSAPTTTVGSASPTSQIPSLV